MPITHEELVNRFSYHPPTEPQKEIHAEIRNFSLRFAEFLVLVCPDSRELSLALTHLEDVMYNANAAISRRSEQKAE